MKKIYFIFLLCMPLIVKSQIYDKKDSLLIMYFNTIEKNIVFAKQPAILNLLDFNINPLTKKREIYFSKLSDTLYIGFAKNLLEIIPKKKHLKNSYNLFVFDSKNIVLYLFKDINQSKALPVGDKNQIIKHVLGSETSCSIYSKDFHIITYITIRLEPFYKSTVNSDIVFYYVYKVDNDNYYEIDNPIGRYHGKYLEHYTEKERVIEYFNDIILNNKNTYVDKQINNKWRKLSYSLYITKHAEKIAKKKLRGRKK